MGRESAQLVERIREKRKGWTGALPELAEKTRRSIRERPGSWLIGGLVAGFITYKIVRPKGAEVISDTKHSLLRDAMTKGLAAAALATWKLWRLEKSPESADNLPVATGSASLEGSQEGF